MGVSRNSVDSGTHVLMNIFQNKEKYIPNKVIFSLIMDGLVGRGLKCFMFSFTCSYCFSEFQ